MKPKFAAAAALIAFLVCTASFLGQRSALAQELKIESECAVLLEPQSGEVLFEKAAHVRKAPASITKVMTLVLAMEAVNSGKVSVDDQVSASENAWDLGGSEVYTEPGETFKLSDWLKAMVVGSANDAAVVVAEHVAGTEDQFVKLMNEKARSLGMKDTNFVNCHGLDHPDHYTTAYDVALLSKYAVSVPGVLELTKIYHEKFREGKFDLYNPNKLLVFYPGCDGLKTGSTSKAGYCVAATAKRGNTRLIAVVMGAPSSQARFNDATKLLNYGFANFTAVEFGSKQAQVASVVVTKGAKTSVAVVASADLALTVRKGEEGTVSVKYDLPQSIPAPVKKGQKVGQAILLKGKQEVKRVDLLAAEDVPQISLVGTFLKFLRKLITWQ
ncbi:MAG: D-alanyl-D-alanine carboxypeptidase family protein [Bacillota bacterium]